MTEWAGPIMFLGGVALGYVLRDVHWRPRRRRHAINRPYDDGLTDAEREAERQRNYQRGIDQTFGGQRPVP